MKICLGVEAGQHLKRSNEPKFFQMQPSHYSHSTMSSSPWPKLTNSMQVRVFGTVYLVIVVHIMTNQSTHNIMLFCVHFDFYEKSHSLRHGRNKKHPQKNFMYIYYLYYLLLIFWLARFVLEDKFCSTNIHRKLLVRISAFLYKN